MSFELIKYPGSIWLVEPCFFPNLGWKTISLRYLCWIFQANGKPSFRNTAILFGWTNDHYFPWKSNSFNNISCPAIPSRIKLKQRILSKHLYCGRPHQTIKWLVGINDLIWLHRAAHNSPIYDACQTYHQVFCPCQGNMLIKLMT